MSPPVAVPASRQFVTDTWEALGTTVVLRLRDADAPTAAKVRRIVQYELDAIDSAASRFRADSELTRVNRNAGSWVPISVLLWEAIGLGLRAARVSDGAVDPTLGYELVEVGYDRDWRELAPVPSQFSSPVGKAPCSTHREQRWREVKLGERPPAVWIPPGVALDLGATAKALTADRAAEAAAQIHPAGALVALGGDIAAAGHDQDEGWAVHVTDDHRASADAPGQTVSIPAGGLATSSTTVRRWRHRNQVQHHILDPRDGQPVRSRWRTVSVSASTCAQANIASTAALVLSDEGPGWLAQHQLPARLVATDGSVQVQGGWPA